MAKVGRKFLIAGIINTAAGLAITSVLFRIYQESVNAYLLTLASNILGITFSFITHKYYVFKSKGAWIFEYLRSYITYGTSLIISVSIFPSLIEFARSIEFAYAMMTVITTGISFIGHKYITFKVKNELPQRPNN